MSGDALTSPAQRVWDFMTGKVSKDLPPSSYRLGTTPAPLHELYPASMTIGFRKALKKWHAKMNKAFISDNAVLHAAETRTSAPVQILRDLRCESVGVQARPDCPLRPSS
jgi:uncharacterized protein